MSIRLTPTIGLAGVYEVKSPYSVKTGALYTCRAIRSFKDVEAQGISVFERYYESYGLSYEIYRQDRESEAYLVTLSTIGSTLVIPDTYIDALPERITDPTSLVVMSVDLGPLPDSLGLSHIGEAIRSQCAELLGYLPEVQLHRVDHTDPLSTQEQDNIEAVRQAAVEIRKDVYTRLRESQDANARLNAKLQAMEALLIENNLVQEPTP